MKNVHSLLDSSLVRLTLASSALMVAMFATGCTADTTTSGDDPATEAQLTGTRRHVSDRMGVGMEERCEGTDQGDRACKELTAVRAPSLAADEKPTGASELTGADREAAGK